jgi:hypothetical protein
MLSTVGAAAGECPHHPSPEHAGYGHRTERAKGDYGKQEAARDGFELAGVLRQGFALRNPQDGGFRFRDGVGYRQPSV